MPIKRNVIFIGIDDRPTRVGIIHGTKCEEILVKLGEFLPVPAGSWVTYSGPEGAELLALEFRDDRLLLNLQDVSDIWAPSPALALTSTVDTRIYFQEIVKYLNLALTKGRGLFHASGTTEIARACQLICEVIANSEAIVRSSQLAYGGLGFTDTALHYCRANLRRKLRRPEIAEYCGISESYLTLLVRKNLGMSLTDVISILRAFRAFEHIVGSSHKIAASAKICGFSSNNYFIRAYRNLNGLTPLQVRKHYHRSSAKTAAEHLALFKLDGFRLINPLGNNGAQKIHSPDQEMRTPFTVANATSTPVVMMPRLDHSNPDLWQDTWIPPGRSRILWSPPGTVWKAMNPGKTGLLNEFQTAVDPTQTLILPAGTRI